jgi:addiction module HigA family antidote
MEKVMSRTPIHPGEILSDELEALDISAAALARKIDVPPNRISQIIAQKRGITADTALRLGKYFGTSPEIWMNLQKIYELDLARTEIDYQLVNITPRIDQHPMA